MLDCLQMSGTGGRTIKNNGLISRGQFGTMTQLVSGYNKGYTQALIDLAEYLPALIDDLKLYRVRMTRQRMDDILTLYTAHREDMKLRRGFVRWNTEKKAFEWYQKED